MIKVNLLDSVTDRAKGVAAVEEKVANPRMQTMLFALVVFGLLAAGMFYDYYSSTSARDDLVSQKTEQERIQAQMIAVNKERTDLQKKMDDTQARINAIQKLRVSQQGPDAVLREIKERFDSVPGLYLQSVEQKDMELTIRGESPNEASVTNFAKSLEYSSGLFNNLSIETQRVAKSDGAGNSPSADPADVPQEVVSFTIKCSYKPATPTAPAAATGQTASANQIAQK